MPMFDYECAECGEAIELIVPSAEKDNARIHEGCGGALNQAWLKPPASGKGAYQMKAVMFKGEQKVGHVDGHFGKSALRKKA